MAWRTAWSPSRCSGLLATEGARRSPRTDWPTESVRREPMATARGSPLGSVGGGSAAGRAVLRVPALGGEAVTAVLACRGDRLGVLLSRSAVEAPLPTVARPVLLAVLLGLAAPRAPVVVDGPAARLLLGALSASECAVGLGPGTSDVMLASAFGAVEGVDGLDDFDGVELWVALVNPHVTHRTSPPAHLGSVTTWVVTPRGY